MKTLKLKIPRNRKELTGFLQWINPFVRLIRLCVTVIVLVVFLNIREVFIEVAKTDPELIGTMGWAFVVSFIIWEIKI